MEHAPLRPVPSRPAGPIEPGAALREVTGWLPSLAPEAAHALALVVLAERPRGEVAVSLGVSETSLSDLLAAARKELRRTMSPLGGSGWCERAERLISDRLDGALADADTRTLDVHLRNCPRCVEHERRLVQATDALVGAQGGGAAAGPAGSHGEDAVVTEISPPDEETPADPAPPPVPEHHLAASTDQDITASTEQDIAAPTEQDIAAAAEVLVAAQTRRQIATAIVWNSLVALAVLLALATIALTVAGILGAEF